MRTVGDYMTRATISIAGELSFDDALERMHAHRIRHLPVFEGEHLVGMVSQRDLGMVGALEGVDPKRHAVREAMSEKPYIVTPSTPVEEVVDKMISTKMGAAIVADGGKVAGIFTTIDALKVLKETLGSWRN